MTQYENLKLKVEARHPILVIDTKEPFAVLEALNQLCGEEQRSLIAWSNTEGLRFINADVKLNQYGQYGLPVPPEGGRIDYKMPPIAAEAMLGCKVNSIIVAHNWHWWFKAEQCRQLLFDIAVNQTSIEKTFVIVGNGIQVPEELSPVVVSIDWNLPDTDELTFWVTAKVNHAGAPINTQDRNKGGLGLPIDNSPEAIRLLVDACRGLTVDELDYTLNEVEVKHGKLDASPEVLLMLAEHKKQMIRKYPMLEYISTEEHEELGGLDLLKAHVDEIALITTNREAAKQMGAKLPQSVMLVGAPGTGKTAMSIEIARRIGWSLIRFKMSEVFGSLLGASEQSMKNALNAIEALAPCVVQVDEIDKAAGSSNSTLDSGTSSRVLGILLTRLQDWMDAPIPPSIFIVATANEAVRLDAALTRRIEDMFYVGLPSLTEREEIFIIHLARVGRYDPVALGLDTRELAALTEGYSGAEIRKVIETAARSGFRIALAAGLLEGMSREVMLDAIKKVIPVSRVKAEQVQAIEAWASMARPASSAAVHVEAAPIPVLEVSTGNSGKLRRQRDAAIEVNQES